MSAVSRRLTIGGLGAALLAGAVWTLHPFRKTYPPTPYDDLLAQLTDRQAAAKLGTAVVKSRPELKPAGLAAQLRRPGQTLKARAARDAAESRLIEAQGWVLPESVGLYAALAAAFA
jgi:hypothetical protein